MRNQHPGTEEGPELVARSFKGRKTNQIRDILDTLVVLGQARTVEEGYVS